MFDVLFRFYAIFFGGPDDLLDPETIVWGNRPVRSSHTIVWGN